MNGKLYYNIDILACRQPSQVSVFNFGHTQIKDAVATDEVS